MYRTFRVILRIIKSWVLSFIFQIKSMTCQAISTHNLSECFTPSTQRLNLFYSKLSMALAFISKCCTRGIVKRSWILYIIVFICYYYFISFHHYFLLHVWRHKVTWLSKWINLQRILIFCKFRRPVFLLYSDILTISTFTWIHKTVNSYYVAFFFSMWSCWK